MKKVFYPLACCLAAGVLVSCSGQKKSGSAQEEQSANEVALSYSKSLKAAEMDSLQLPVDADGYITIFDGKTFNGWRGYGKDRVPSKWTIEDGCIKFNGSGGGENDAGC
jgi:type II secretory pathway pseudopilin PulG